MFYNSYSYQYTILFMLSLHNSENSLKTFLTTVNKSNVLNTYATWITDFFYRVLYEKAYINYHKSTTNKSLSDLYKAEMSDFINCLKTKNNPKTFDDFIKKLVDYSRRNFHSYVDSVSILISLIVYCIVPEDNYHSLATMDKIQLVKLFNQKIVEMFANKILGRVQVNADDELQKLNLLSLVIDKHDDPSNPILFVNYAYRITELQKEIIYNSFLLPEAKNNKQLESQLLSHETMEKYKKHNTEREKLMDSFMQKYNEREKLLSDAKLSLQEKDVKIEKLQALIDKMLLDRKKNKSIEPLKQNNDSIKHNNELSDENKELKKQLNMYKSVVEKENHGNMDLNQIISPAKSILDVQEEISDESIFSNNDEFKTNDSNVNDDEFDMFA